MTAYRALIQVDIKKKGKKMKCEIQNLSWMNAMYEFPQSIYNMQGEMAWYNKVAYVLAGLITQHYRISCDNDNSIITALLLYSPYKDKFKQYGIVYEERYKDIECDSERATNYFYNLILKDTEELAKVLLPLVIRLLQDEEMWIKAKKKVYIQYARTGTDNWHNARVNKCGVTESDHPTYYPYYRALELYRKLGRWYRYNGKWQFRMIGEHGEAIPEQSELETEAEERWKNR